MTWGLAKKMTFRNLESLFEGFRYEYFIKRMLSMRFITKKIQDSPPKKLCEMPWGPLFKFNKFLFLFLCFKVFIVV